MTLYTGQMRKNSGTIVMSTLCHQDKGMLTNGAPGDKWFCYTWMMPCYHKANSNMLLAPGKQKVCMPESLLINFSQSNVRQPSLRSELKPVSVSWIPVSGTVSLKNLNIQKTLNSKQTEMPKESFKPTIRNEVIKYCVILS